MGRLRSSSPSGRPLLHHHLCNYRDIRRLYCRTAGGECHRYAVEKTSHRPDYLRDGTHRDRHGSNKVSDCILCRDCHHDQLLPSEIATPAKLYLDVETYTSFADIPVKIPRVSTAAYADIDPSGFKFAPGGPSSINMVRAYYRWKITTDIVRPYITTIRPANGSMPTDFLIVATTAFQNEKYP